MQQAHAVRLKVWQLRLHWFGARARLSPRGSFLAVMDGARNAAMVVR